GALVAVAIMEPHFFYFAALGLPAYLVARAGLAGWDRSALRVGAGRIVVALALGACTSVGALSALAARGWHPSPIGRVAVGALIPLATLAVWQALAGSLVAAGVSPDARSAARRSLTACWPWLALAAAGTGLGGRIAPLAGLVPLLVHAIWL